MDHLQIELAKLRRDANLKQSMDDVDKIIEQLEKARETIIAGKKMWERRLCSGYILMSYQNRILLL